MPQGPPETIMRTSYFVICLIFGISIFTFAMALRSYTAIELLNIRQKINQPQLRLNSESFAKITELGIIKTTHRGTRAGINRPRPIKVITSNTSKAGQTNKQSHGSNINNLVSVPIHKYNISSLLSANVRSLVLKIDDLQSVCNTNNVDIMALSETWLKPTMPDEPYRLSGLVGPVRNDRVNRQEGGVAVYINANFSFKHWSHLSEPDLETIWITLRPPHLPREIPMIVLGVLYHQPSSKDSPLTQHIHKCLDAILSKHPDAGIILTGDLNHLRTNSIMLSYNLRQTVWTVPEEKQYWIKC